jgi:hypothetical protein
MSVLKTQLFILQTAELGLAEMIENQSAVPCQNSREALEKINRQANEMQVLGAPAVRVCTAIIQ